MRLIVLPGTTVNTAVREFAETGSFTLVCFEVSFIDLSVAEDQLTLTVSESLANLTFVDDVSHISQFIFGFLKAIHPVARNFRSDAGWNNEIRAFLSFGISVHSDRGSVAR